MNEADLYAAARIEQALWYARTKKGDLDDVEAFAEAIRSNAPTGAHVRLVHEKPSDGLLVSMALRYDHAFGMMDRASQQSLLTQMRQIHEEVVGVGFYHPDKENEYLDMLCPEGEEREPLNKQIMGLFSEVWICPSCEYENPSRNGTWNWCGKNLQCPGCKEYHYYSEYRMKDDKS